MLYVTYETFFSVQRSVGRAETREPTFERERFFRQKNDQNSSQAVFAAHRNSSLQRKTEKFDKFDFKFEVEVDQLEKSVLPRPCQCSNT